MSIAIQSAVWEHSSFSGTALLLLLAIADFADDEGRSFPSISTLARKIRSTPRNTQLTIRALKASGELEIETGQGPHGTNLYTVKPTSGVKSTSGMKPTSRRGEVLRRLPLKPTSSKPSMNHQEPTCVSAAKQISRFLDFWKAYPRKRSKGDAEKAWSKQNLDAKVDEIIAAVEAQKTWPDWLKDNGRFIPHPASWLNAKGWENELGTLDVSNSRIPNQNLAPRKFKAVM